MNKPLTPLHFQLGVGGVLCGGIMLGAFWLRNDRPIIRMRGWVQNIGVTP